MKLPVEKTCWVANDGTAHETAEGAYAHSVRAELLRVLKEKQEDVGRGAIGFRGLFPHETADLILGHFYVTPRI